MTSEFIHPQGVGGTPVARSRAMDELLAQAAAHSHQSPRVLHILRAPVGGLFRHVRDLAVEQQARGILVGVVCADDDGDDLTTERLLDLSHACALGLLPPLA